MALEFEWDEDKAAANWFAHGRAFPEAIQAFSDPFAMERIDERVSARRAERHEQDDYHRENAP